MILALKRIIKTGFINFWRNGFVSTSSVVVMSITLFVIGSLIFVNEMLDSSLNLLKDKVDINAYFTIDAPEESILAVQSRRLPTFLEKKLRYVFESDTKTRR